MNEIRDLQDRLCEYFGRKHCLYTGRGTSALYLAFQSLSGSGRKVILPDICCTSPANAALYAGLEPWFSDVRLSDYTLDPDCLERLVELHDDIAAIVPVHLYGHPAEMKRITEIAGRKGIPVIEDAAQAMGGELVGRKLGSYGDLSVLSFGHTKILDVGQGGAILTDSDEVYARLLNCEQLPTPPTDLAATYETYRHTYYTLRQLTELDERLNELFIPIPEIFRSMYLIGPDSSRIGETLKQLDRLDELVEVRRTNAELFASALQHPDIELPSMEPGGVPWRFSFLLPEGRQQSITEQLRQRGFDASNWYPPLHSWYHSGKRQDRNSFPNSTRVANRVLNLWVDPATEPSLIAKTCEVVLQLLEEGQGSSESETRHE